MKRAFKIAACLSLALNVVFIGLAIGFAAKHVPLEMLLQDKQREILAVLPADKIHQVVPTVTNSMAVQREALGRLLSLRQRMLLILRTEPFDRTAFQAGFQEVKRTREMLDSAVTDIIIAVASEADPESREKLAKKLESLPLPAAPKPPA